MSLSLRLRNKLEIFGLGLKYGKNAKAIGKKYNLQNLIGAREAEKIIGRVYAREQDIFKIIKRKLKETRPPWFIRNITLSAYACNQNYEKTFSEECLYDMITGSAFLYPGGDSEDDFCDNYLESFISSNEKYERILDLLRDTKNLIRISSGNREALNLAKATHYLLTEGASRLRRRSERAFEEYSRRKRERLDPVQAKDFYYRFCLRKGRIEEVRKNLVSLEKILETQRKLGEIGATWAVVSHLLAGGEEGYLEDLEKFYLNGTSLLNLAADDLKEVEEDFAYDPKSKVGIKNPANVLALKMVSEGYDHLSLKELKNYLKKNSIEISRMIVLHAENLEKSYENLKDSPYEEDLPYVFGFMEEIVEREVKKFEKRFKIKVMV